MQAQLPPLGASGHAGTSPSTRDHQRSGPRPARRGGTVGWRKSYAYVLGLRCLSGSRPFELRVTDEPLICQTRLGAAAPVPAPQVSTTEGQATLLSCVQG